MIITEPWLLIHTGWLEFDTAANVEAWVTAENKVTFGYLEQIPFRSKIKDRLNDIFNYPKYSSPFRVGEYYFFSKNDGSAEPVGDLLSERIGR